MTFTSSVAPILFGQIFTKYTGSLPLLHYLVPTVLGKLLDYLTS